MIDEDSCFLFTAVVIDILFMVLKFCSFFFKLDINLVDIMLISYMLIPLLSYIHSLQGVKDPPLKSVVVKTGISEGKVGSTPCRPHTCWQECHPTLTST